MGLKRIARKLLGKAVPVENPSATTTAKKTGANAVAMGVVASALVIGIKAARTRGISLWSEDQDAEYVAAIMAGGSTAWTAIRNAWKVWGKAKLIEVLSDGDTGADTPAA